MVSKKRVKRGVFMIDGAIRSKADLKESVRFSKWKGNKKTKVGIFSTGKSVNRYYTKKKSKK